MSSTKSVETPLPISAMAVQRRIIVKPGKDDISFQFALDSTAPPEDFYQVMDVITDISDREELKVKRAEKVDELQNARLQPVKMELDIERMRADRLAYMAAHQAMYERSGKVRPFRLTEKQEADVKQFDEEIERTRNMALACRGRVPLIEWELACIEARLAGQPEPARPKGLRDLEEVSIAA